ncbi:MAG TPA: sulfurtransferase [Trueperaceae bacterium]
MSNLMQVDELARRLGEPGLRIVDVRFDLNDTEAGEREYRKGHLPGAVYAHLDRDLSAPLGRHGGRHPLPDPERLAGRLGELGIGNDDLVVAYDAGNGMVASRLWWLLRYLGSDRVKVLDGGFAAWTDAGHPVTREVTEPSGARFEPRVRSEMAVDRDYVLRNLGVAGKVLVDARAPQRYRGEVEPLDPIAGHIPSAINIPFEGNLEGGRFRSSSQLRRRYETLADADEVVVYCGSGVSAAHDLLAMEEAGLEGAKLYHGSWSDWCSFDDAPVATGSES